MTNPTETKTNNQDCPQCAGTMEIKVIGTMEDKVWSCPYCEKIIDITDSFFTKEEENTDSFIDGSGNRVTKRTVVSKHRIDGDYTGIPDMGSLHTDALGASSIGGMNIHDANVDDIFAAVQKEHPELKNKFRTGNVSVEIEKPSISSTKTVNKEFNDISGFKEFLSSQTDMKSDDIANLLKDFDMPNGGGADLFSGMPQGKKESYKRNA